MLLPQLVAIELLPVPDLTTGASLQLTAIGVFADSTRQDISAQVSWLSTDPKILTINNIGLLTAIAVGSTNIQASFNDIYAQLPVTVIAPPVAKLTAIEISAIPELTAGTTLQLTATGLFDDGSRVNITNQVNWIANSPGILNLDSTGLLMALNAGTALIHAELSGIRSQMQINVLPAIPAKLTGIEISVVPQLTAGATLQLSATGLFDDGSRTSVTDQVSWQSNNINILTVSTTGLLTAVRAGSTTVQAKLDDISTELQVNVLAPPPAKLTTIEILAIPQLTAGTTLQFNCNRTL